MNWLKVSIFLILVGCSSSGTLNNTPHQFGKKSKIIIWLQVAGLSEEHLALYKFSKLKTNDLLSFEKAQCTGNLWNFNSYKLRPSAKMGFLSQLTGNSNLKNKCDDISKPAIWSYLGEVGFRSVLLESGVSQKESISTYRSCENGDLFFSSLSHLRMKKSKSKNQFHFQSKEKIKAGESFDQSCQKGDCFVSLLNNVRSVYEQLRENPTIPSLFIIQDFRFLKEVKKRNFSRAKEILVELEKIHAYFMNKRVKEGEDLSLIVSSSAVQQFEMPRRGKEWARFEKRGRGIIFRNQSLVSSVWSVGPGSENFCGIFEEKQILNRILWQEQGTEFDLDQIKSYFY